MVIDSSLAKALARQTLANWMREGKALDEGLNTIVRNASVRFRSLQSPTKFINQTVPELKLFFQNPAIHGSIAEAGGRRIVFNLHFPEWFNENLVFTIVSGSLNGRTGNFEIRRVRAASTSLHVVERLHQRLGVIEPDLVLREIYSAIDRSEVMRNAANKVGAHFWPLLSDHGMFVTSPEEGDSMGNTLITWMRFDQLGKRWGRIADELRSLAKSKPALLCDVDFCSETLRLHSWLLRPYMPGPDEESARWDRALAQAHSASGNDAPSESSVKSANENDLTGCDGASATGNEGQLPSSDIEPGLNYFSEPPKFGLHEKFNGLVMLRKVNGTLVVALGNGWFGSIPGFAVVRDLATMVGAHSIEVGDRVTVEVRKIKRILDGKAYLVALQLGHAADIAWNSVEERYPVGMDVDGQIARMAPAGATVMLADGVLGLLGERELKRAKINLPEGIALDVGVNVGAKVKAYRPDKRRLVLTIRPGYDFTTNQQHGLPRLGDRFEGTVSDVMPHGVRVNFSQGISGLIPKGLVPDGRILSIGELVPVEVIGLHGIGGLIPLAYVRSDEGRSIPVPITEPDDAAWAQFDKVHAFGEVVEVRIAHSFNGGFTVVLADGALGVLPDSELTWGQDTQAAKDVLEVGQFLKAKITGKRSQTRRLQLSARECVTHPLEDATALKSLEGELQGTIAKIVDYGVFVSLPIGLNGLLHKTVFPEGATFRKGQAICVRVLSIDVERRRISLGVAVPTD